MSNGILCWEVRPSASPEYNLQSHYTDFKADCTQAGSAHMTQAYQYLPAAAHLHLTSGPGLVVFLGNAAGG